MDRLTRIDPLTPHSRRIIGTTIRKARRGAATFAAKRGPPRRILVADCREGGLRCQLVQHRIYFCPHGHRAENRCVRTWHSRLQLLLRSRALPDTRRAPRSEVRPEKNIIRGDFLSVGERFPHRFQYWVTRGGRLEGHSGRRNGPLLLAGGEPHRQVLPAGVPWFRGRPL